MFLYVVAKSQGKLIFSETENHLDGQALLQTSTKKVIYIPSWTSPKLCLIAVYLYLQVQTTCLNS